VPVRRPKNAIPAMSGLRLLIAFLLLLGTGPLRAASLNVYAAASLADALQEIARTYEPASGDKPVFNFAASSALGLQIRNGAPADIFFSADEAKMDELAKAGLIASDTRRSLVSNTLVIVVATEGKVVLNHPTDLAKSGFGRIALAEPQTVPAGIYAKAWLEKISLWKSVIGKMVPTENVRACLAAVEAGNVDAGIVYKTDALISKKVKVAYEVDAADGPKISYPVAVLKEARQPAAARKFAAYLAGPEARAVFIKFGFLPVQ
jgi:molybdate transport system substrate-binding protein